jgi:hypothetical protein
LFIVKFQREVKMRKLTAIVVISILLFPSAVSAQMAATPASGRADLYLLAYAMEGTGGNSLAAGAAVTPTKVGEFEGLIQCQAAAGLTSKNDQIVVAGNSFLQVTALCVLNGKK